MTQVVTVILGDPRISEAERARVRFGRSDLIAIEKLHSALSTMKEFQFCYLNEHRDLVKRLHSSPPSFVLNLCDEGFRRDPLMVGHIPALLDMLAIPYSGAKSACLAACRDMTLVRSIARSLGIQVPDELYLPPKSSFDARGVALPAIIKPSSSAITGCADDGSPVGSAEEAQGRVERLRIAMPGEALLVQEFLPGPEYQVGVIGNPSSGLDMLPILEFDTCKLDAKLPPVTASQADWRMESLWSQRTRCREAKLSPENRRRINGHVAVLFERLDCRDYAQMTFRADSAGLIKLLEVNPNPDWRLDGKLAIMAGFRGLQYADMLRTILCTALARVRHLNDHLHANDELRRSSRVARRALEDH